MVEERRLEWIVNEVGSSEEGSRLTTRLVIRNFFKNKGTFLPNKAIEGSVGDVVEVSTGGVQPSADQVIKENKINTFVINHTVLPHEIFDKKNLSRKECLLLPLRTVLKALKI